MLDYFLRKCKIIDKFRLWEKNQQSQDNNQAGQALSIPEMPELQQLSEPTDKDSLESDEDLVATDKDNNADFIRVLGSSEQDQNI